MVQDKTEEEKSVVEYVRSMEHAIKHPLQDTWCLWLNQRNKSWGANLTNLASVSTVEDFWCIYHHIKQPSELRIGQDCAWFKDGIEPKWEDPANKNGGRWLIDKKGKKEMDAIFLDIVLMMIGDNFEDRELLCGVVVNVRGTIKNKISIWTSDVKHKNGLMKIGKVLMEYFQFGEKMEFQVHDSSSFLYCLK